MAYAGPPSCPQCGAPVSVASGRCPFCGANITAGPAPAGGAVLPPPTTAAPVGYSAGAYKYGSPKPAARAVDAPAQAGARIGMAVGVAGVMVLAAGATLFFLFRSNAPPPPVVAPRPTATATVAPPPSDVVTLTTPAQTDPSDLYPRVFTKARGWTAEPRLLSIVAGPVVDKKADLSGPDGRIVYTFFGRRDVTRPKDGSGRLVITVTGAGTTAVPGGGTATDEKNLVDEPTCVSWSAMKAARASGVPADVPLEARYEMDTALGRAIWRTSVAGRKDLDRFIDGQSCAIIARR